MKMPTESEPVTIVEGDCLSMMARLPAGSVDAVVTDPPYGMRWNTDSTRFSGGKGGHKKKSPRIHGDDEQFDPTPLLRFSKVVLWGSNHFSRLLPVGTTLVWVKKSDAKLGVMLSDAEVAWMKGGHGVYVRRQIWDGCAREGSENGKHLHPTQKPVGIMQWCIEQCKLSPGSLIIDPYAGSGTTAVAAVKMGHRCILIEKEPAYVEIARRRVSEAMGTGLLAGVG